MELATMNVTLFGVEERGNGVHSIGVTAHNHLIRQLVGADMEVECAVVLVDNQFGRSKI